MVASELDGEFEIWFGMFFQITIKVRFMNQVVGSPAFAFPWSLVVETEMMSCPMRPAIKKPIVRDLFVKALAVTLLSSLSKVGSRLLQHRTCISSQPGARYRLSKILEISETRPCFT